MDTKNTARGILCERINRAPKTRYVRLVRMKPEHEKVCFVVSEEANDAVYLLAFHKMGLKFDSFAQCGLASPGLQSFVSLHPITVDYQCERRVCSVGKGSVSGWGLKDRYCRSSAPNTLARRIAEVSARLASGDSLYATVIRLYMAFTYPLRGPERKL